ncbi:MAG: hypothetical protein AB4426_20105 [Xenococcaceae cyanobacterium]
MLCATYPTREPVPDRLTYLLESLFPIAPLNGDRLLKLTPVHVGAPLRLRRQAHTLYLPKNPNTISTTAAFCQV